MFEAKASLKILVAEDSAADRLILQSMLERAGHSVVLVEDGQKAIDAFTELAPDIVFLDVMMPNLNGIEAAKRIKALAGDELVPVIFLSSLADAESLATCLDAGGDDFLSKPYNQLILDAKIRAYARMRDMHKMVAMQKDQIELNNKHLLQEQTVAKQVFDKIAHAGVLHLDYIDYYMSALAVFNGDVLLADISPRGNLFVILGDFTGHGLPAAIGSMPLASTFYGMVSKGFFMPDILREINQKLYQTLPVGLFCCATCVDIDFHKMRASIWNGGFPDNVLFNAKNNSYSCIKSKHLPLGVLSHRDFKVEVESFDLAEGDHFLMWSDGILEARNSDGEMFGEERVFDLLSQVKSDSFLQECLIGAVQSHIGRTEKDDDLSVVDMPFPGKAEIDKELPKPGKGHGYLVDWELSLKLDATSLKTFSPLSMLITMISEVPGLRQSSSVLYTVLSEFYNNAVEHGVLGLASEIKSSPSGFAEYYKQRKDGLAALTEAFVKFEFAHKLDDEGGSLKISVTDSGKGFTPKQAETTEGASVRYYGRGLSLVGSICESVQVLEPGNRVEAVYRWSFEDQK